MGLFGLFGKKEIQPQPGPVEPLVLVDIHSHLIPGIDDGAQKLEDSVALAEGMVALGYRKMITTPHSMEDTFVNEPEAILEGLEALNAELIKRQIPLMVEAAAEYYLDGKFMQQVRDKKLLTFGGNFVLMEMNFVSETDGLNEAVFQCKVAGYEPVLAHPERYIHMYDEWDRYEELWARDVKFQINLMSLTGHYSEEAKRIAEKLVMKGMVSFVGSDLHHVRHLPKIEAALRLPIVQKLRALPLLNNSLM